jgi:hypothetical protein
VSGGSGFLDPPQKPLGAVTLAQHSLGGGGCAGYTATGRDFRYAQAIVRVPLTSAVPIASSAAVTGGTANNNQAEAAAPTIWVGLSSGDATAGIAIMTCFNYVNTFFGVNNAAADAAAVLAVCPQSVNATASFLATGAGAAGTGYYAATNAGWVAVGWVDTTGGLTLQHATALSGITGGDGVKLSVYYPAGGSAHFVITTNPTTPAAASTSFQLPSGGNFFAVFDRAVALVDYSSSATLSESVVGAVDTEAAVHQIAVPGPAASADQRITQFQQGAWTTTGGVRGTFSPPAAARWTLTSPTLTSNGSTPPSGTANVEPAFLWNDGIGNGFGDAFGVWWRH